MAHSYDGTGDSTDAASGIVFTSSWTITLYTKSDSGTNDAEDTCYGMYSVDFLGCDMRGTGSDFHRLGVFSGGSERAVQHSTQTADGNWHFLSHDFTDGSSGAINLYLDDMDTNDGSASGSYGTFTAPINSFSFGMFGGLTGRDYTGEIAQVQIFDYVLSAGERKTAAIIPFFGNLLCYQMIEPSTEDDMTSNANDGTVTNATVTNQPHLQIVTLRS